MAEKNLFQQAEDIDSELNAPKRCGHPDCDRFAIPTLRFCLRHQRPRVLLIYFCLVALPGVIGFILGSLHSTSPSDLLAAELLKEPKNQVGFGLWIQGEDVAMEGQKEILLLPSFSGGTNTNSAFALFNFGLIYKGNRAIEGARIGVSFPPGIECKTYDSKWQETEAKNGGKKYVFHVPKDPVWYPNAVIDFPGIAIKHTEISSLPFKFQVEVTCRELGTTNLEFMLAGVLLKDGPNLPHHEPYFAGIKFLSGTRFQFVPRNPKDISEPTISSTSPTFKLIFP